MAMMGYPPAGGDDLMARLGAGLGENKMALLGAAAQLLGGGGFTGAGNAMMAGSKVDQSNRYLKKEEAEKKQKKEEEAARRAALEGALGKDAVDRMGLDNATEYYKTMELYRNKPKEPENTKYFTIGDDLVSVPPGGAANVMYRGAPKSSVQQVGDDLVRVSGDDATPIYRGSPKVTERQRDLIAAGLDPTSPEGRQALIGNKQFSPYEVEQQKTKAASESGWKTTAEGAESFLRKVEGLKEKIKTAGDSAFGPLQGGTGWLGGVYRQQAAIRGTDAEKARQRLEAELADIELDIAKMDLKGQGSVTESERMIARKKIGGLGVNDAKTQLAILDGLAEDARATLQQAARIGANRGGGQGAASPAPTTQGAGAPTPAAVQYLRANPQFKEDFDAKYGAGSAARILGGQ